MRCEVRIQREDFDVASEWQACRRRCRGEAGAIVAFGGLVRDMAHGEAGVDRGRAVHGLRLEHYPGMTESSIEAIVAEASERWRLRDAVVIHRVGDLAPKDQIVLVLIASSHRPDAFAACEFVMDYLKTDAVLWKKERFAAGETWLRATANDRKRRADWQRAAEQ